MFDLQSTTKISCEDLQFQLVLSYIRHASEKLAFKESQLILQSTDFINFITSSDQKSITEPSTTQASFQNTAKCIQYPTSPRSRQRQAFKRKTKRGVDRHTFGSLQEVLQQAKQVCSQSATAVIQEVFREYRQMLGQIGQIDYNKDTLANKKCHHCQIKEVNNVQLQSRIKKISGQLQQALQRNKQLNKSLQQKISQNEKLIISQSNCKAFLLQKQGILAARTNQIKLTERQIVLGLANICELNGCERCTSIRAIKTQIVSFRTYLQRQSQNMDKLYLRYKKRFEQ